MKLRIKRTMKCNRMVRVTEIKINHQSEIRLYPRLLTSSKTKPIVKVEMRMLVLVDPVYDTEFEH